MLCNASVAWLTIRNSRLRRRIVFCGGLFAHAVIALHAHAQEAESRYDFHIEETALGPAITAFVRYTDKNVLFPYELAGETGMNPVIGHYTIEEALKVMLQNTKFSGGLSDNGVLFITLSGEKEWKDREGRMASGELKKGLLASVAAFFFSGANAQDVETIGDAQADDARQEEERDVIIVTGTNIRGIAPESSPVRSFSREDIQITGAGTAQDFIQTLTANFGGGANEGFIGLPNDSGSSGNIGRASSVNLRGLGSGSTLVLLNGRRLAQTSTIGNFVDISVIPATAIERVDVMTDGASSIYGADAVAGVVNFVLRDDYDGVEASVRYGSVTEGNLDEYRTNLTGGKSWDTGNMLVAYEFFSQTNLGVEDRTFSRGAPLPNDLSPSQRRHSVLASASQDISPDVKISADAGFSRRDAVFTTTSVGNSTLIQDSDTSTFNASLGATWEISDSWFIDLAGAYGRVDLNAAQNGADANTTDSEIYTVDLLASGDVFSLPAGAVKLAVGGHFRAEGFSTFFDQSNFLLSELDREIYAVYGEAFIPLIGPENNLPGVERFEVNVSGRYSDFSDFGSTANPKVGVLWSPIEDLRLRGSYSTSFNPPAVGIAGLNNRTAFAYSTALFNERLNLTAGDPSIADVTGLQVGGTSPSLGPERSRAFTGGVDFDKDWGRHQLTFGATYFDIRFEGRIGMTPVPGNRDSFDVPNIAFNSPELFPDGTIIFDPTLDQINAALANLDSPLAEFGDVDVFEAAFISFATVQRNLSLSLVRGFDFDLNYAFTADHGSFSLGLDGTFLRDFQQQGSVTTPIVELVNTQFNPVDLKLRGRAGYSSGGFSANFFVNYTDSYRVNDAPDAALIDSWTTVDLNLAYDTQDRFRNVMLSNAQFRLSVRNLFNENPPSTPGFPALRIFAYDPSNASPRNRFVSFEVAKQF